MTREDLQMVAFNIILHSGNARSLINESLRAMREGDFDLAHEKMDEANKALVEAHHSQTKLLQDFASGQKIEIEIIMVHAQDHLMTTITLQEVARELEYLYKQNQEIMAKVKVG
ncbi:PTS cellobiose transporter subunit IIA [Streptococcaceae bacterium ESL0687]|nr:PTS cellobiose transporter subunit IIA [Streptococcaceae bacterium ESL0687]